jgi:threonine/homoserine/homoserine lactone efflux protein
VWFRAMLVWLTFPPMLLLAFDEPVLMVIIYASLGALFMPFLAITLVWLLNLRVGREYRSGLLSNVILVASVLVFAALAVQEIIGAIGGG